MLLILGGTGEAKMLAKALYQQGMAVTYSIAGLVRQPDLPCKVVSGGFSQFGGLADYVRDNQIAAILDASHPFAEKISQSAYAAASVNDIPLWCFRRPAWQAVAGDRWSRFSTVANMQAHIRHYQSIFLTIGQLNQSWLTVLADLDCQVLLRTAVQPKRPLSSKIKWIQGIPPFSLEDEIDVMRQHQIDCLISKNSGGDKTYAKLQAARELGIDVLMLERPTLVQVDAEFNEPDACKSFIIDALSELK